MKNYFRQKSSILFCIFFILINGILYWYIKTEYIKLEHYHLEMKELKLQLQKELLLLNQKSKIINKLDFFRQQNLIPKIDSDKIFFVISPLLLKVAEENGLIIQYFKPLRFTKNVGFFDFAVEIKATGTFLQFIDFIAILNKFYFPVEIVNFTLESKEDEHVKISMQLVGFHLPIPFLSMLRLQPLPTFLRDPFSKVNHNDFLITNTTDKSSHVLLQSIPLEQIKFVGYLKNGKQKWLLAMLPEGQTVDIKIGDIFGIEKASLLFADKNNIYLQVGKQKEIRHYLI